MENQEQYPIYRKLKNNRRFYKVIDSKLFEEIQIIGTKVKKMSFEAKQYPEILFISDIIKLNHEGIIESSESEWLSVVVNY